MNALENFFGDYEKYYAIDGGEFPPKALLSGRKDGVCYGITAGVSLIPMPCVEQNFSEDAGNLRRMELGFAAVEEHEALCKMMYSTLSGLSGLPWKEVTFLAHGHTIPFENVKGFLIGRPLCYGEEAFGINQYRAVTDILLKYNVPILMDLDIGHLPPMMPIISGSTAKVTSKGDKISIEYTMN